ncbi:CRISPLD1 [Branchiostoma lanceolatum]|uniref:CRISPLD1 protein n=1 Tax=Branchiostoma lanceolatum TaxID=7740 RepID=A0A8K0F181_BRALA|nr:CRISPLD1 [Branchiostoma lanceolatum]
MLLWTTLSLLGLAVAAKRNTTSVDLTDIDWDGQGWVGTDRWSLTAPSPTRGPFGRGRVENTVTGDARLDVDTLPSQGSDHGGRVRRQSPYRSFGDRVSYLTSSEKLQLLQKHNELRGKVQPYASNMEEMVWDEKLAISSQQWADQCIWEHGPNWLLPLIGQNLAVHTRLDKPLIDLVQMWYDEHYDFTYPSYCRGPMCTHYTQMVWATTTKVGCAIRLCETMQVWGEEWPKTLYLVCDYSSKGNWIGYAPYKRGRPCSQCPPKYGGRCANNLCTNSVYAQNQGSDPRSRNHDRDRNRDSNRNRNRDNEVAETSYRRSNYVTPRTKLSTEPEMKEVSSQEYFVRKATCRTKISECRDEPCIRFRCPANCGYIGDQVIGTLWYDARSSICQAGVHYGAVTNSGGLVDVTNKDEIPFFTGSYRSGITSIGTLTPARAFMISRVGVMQADCRTTVDQYCPYRGRPIHCPRFYCPPACASYQYARVYGTGTYTDNSSICRAAIHAGVLQDYAAGYVDVWAGKGRTSYRGSSQNGVTTESYDYETGSAFKVFKVE